MSAGKSRRYPPEVPELSGMTWENARRPIHALLKWVAQFLYNSLPAPHEATHLAGGSDALQTPAAPPSDDVNQSSSVGTGPSYAYENHRHGVATPLNAKGDLLTQSAPGAYVRVPVGPDGQILVADSTQAPGMKWTGPGSLTAGLSLPGSVQGDDGDPGPMGPPGQAGAAGAPGATGPTGAMGPPGFAIDGDDGLPGPMGASGADGAPGALGFPGADGDDGLMGPVPAGQLGNNGAGSVYGTDPFQGSNTPGTFVLPTGKFAIMRGELSLSSSERATLQGTARLVIEN
jgi:hypothetical protein